MANPDDHFPIEDWNLDFRAELYKQEFYATAAWMDKRDTLVAPWETSTAGELKDLLELKKNERSEHIGEIIQEQQGLVLIGYWFDMLEVGRESHPRTTELLHATTYLAGSVATYFKARFNRVRPWVLEPDLFPPIPSPGLPAYPSGHATQTHLAAKLLTYLVPHRKEEFENKAENVAVNRERAGLNFPSDTVAGRQLAERVFGILTTQCERFQSTLHDAKVIEWNQAKSSHRQILPKAGLLS